MKPNEQRHSEFVDKFSDVGTYKNQKSLGLKVPPRGLGFERMWPARSFKLVIATQNRVFSCSVKEMSLWVSSGKALSSQQRSDISLNPHCWIIRGSSAFSWHHWARRTSVVGWPSIGSAIFWLCPGLVTISWGRPGAAPIKAVPFHYQEAFASEPLRSTLIQGTWCHLTRSYCLLGSRNLRFRLPPLDSEERFPEEEFYV